MDAYASSGGDLLCALGPVHTHGPVVLTGPDGVLLLIFPADLIKSGPPFGLSPDDPIARPLITLIVVARPGLIGHTPGGLVVPGCPLCVLPPGIGLPPGISVPPIITLPPGGSLPPGYGVPPGLPIGGCVPPMPCRIGA